MSEYLTDPDRLDEDDLLDVDEFASDEAPDVAELPHPVNWNLLTAEELEAEWFALDRWVTWLRRTYGLPALVVPPFWHHHPELVWELSALHLHWLAAYDPEQNASAAIGWHRDFADARARLRDWVAASGTRIDRDRPTRQTVWPGEEPAEPVEDTAIADRAAEFEAFVTAEVAQRRQAEDDFYAAIAEEEP
ncbi:hypothetical protein G9U51_01095 [Calidifontibacter sp. DB0510]|uniref:DUF4913 domain-containing protein n=1 Tax=Metallococcus carri TaxID=1656884 RepID=A0A967AYY3_9MICO|nr:hypothetical protein [Metallococcus carri]NOP36781.1 hypothetical protein [Calidifontibacter sp. DB2511S]